MTIIQKTVDYLRSAKSEMHKVSWPSRRDTLRYSSLIIGISVAVALGFAALDYGFTWTFDNTVLRYAQNRNQAQIQTEEIPIAPVTPEAGTGVDIQPVSPDINLEDAKPIETPNTNK